MAVARSDDPRGYRHALRLPRGDEAGALRRACLPACERIFVDISRPGTQRFCSTECANRAAVRRHRDRAKAS
ncbi:CGNR zinc finger domain-containing protein [Agreia bicolorata]|uniref:CGNR zinc finger domain-containing protein n=1 Tax=Agreia bicolorata TaxID=110935 RepID=UPI0013792F2D